MNYLCGSCNRSRPEEKVELIEHKNESLGCFPICQDAPCTIDDVKDFTKTESEFKIDSELK